MSSVENITVVSGDSTEFEMTVGAAKQSELLKRMLDDDNCVVDRVPLSNVNTTTLVKVMEYCQKHADHEAAMAGARVPIADVEELKAWDAEFMKVDTDMLYHILTAADYMEILGLFDLACQTVADLIKGKNPKKIRRIFNIKNDLTPQEEQRFRAKYRWDFY
ncbi:SKP1-like protein 1 [Prosopis cineraria]|uniref:SKP1-like protein 1 n=1 Tax=Prosopis cineraria TaxID=364024 RepID=UPI0024108C2C|nr:SKP1-like protein 1 [Prosopis cineraria]